MVIELSIIPALRLHILCGIRNGPAACGNLFLEHLELSSASLHPIAATVSLHRSVFLEGKTNLAKSKRLSKRDDFALSLVDPYSDSLETADNFSGNLLQLFNIRENDVVIIHIMPSYMDARLALYPVIDAAWEGYHFLL